MKNIPTKVPAPSIGLYLNEMRKTPAMGSNVGSGMAGDLESGTPFGTEFGRRSCKGSGIDSSRGSDPISNRGRFSVKNLKLQISNFVEDQVWNLPKLKMWRKIRCPMLDQIRELKIRVFNNISDQSFEQVREPF